MKKSQNTGNKKDKKLGFIFYNKYLTPFNNYMF